MNNFLESALKYAAMGWRIFPLCAGQKIPITSHGVKDATTDERQIKAWWEKWPNANIGVACGSESGIYVIDVDVSASGEINGIKSLTEFTKLPETVTQQTPRGGFHGFFSAKVPPANRNSFRPGIDIRGDGYYVVLAPSIHPNGGRYHWIDGLAPGQHELADYPDFMRPVTRAPWATPLTARTPVAGATARADFSDNLRRASLYLAQCEAAVQGQAGHDKLLWACTAMVRGCRLSEGQAYDLLASEYNPRCVPPWDLSKPADEKDFRRKVSEAGRISCSLSEGWILDDPAYAPISTSNIDIKSLLLCKPTFSDKCWNQSEVVVSSAIAGELQFLTQPTGLLGEICSWINSTSLKEQPFLSLACSLAFLGALFGRKIKDSLGSRTNLYCMGIALSSAGKNHALSQIRRLCEAAGCVSLLGGSNIASDSAIEERISREPATLFMWDEIGHLLTHIKSGISQHYAQVVSLLMQLYSSAGSVYLGKEYAEKEKQRVISQPCCCIYGVATPEKFTGGISPSELQDGWLSRCLVFSSPNSPAKKRGRIEQPVPARIADQVRAWYSRRFDAPNDGHSLGQYVTTSSSKPAPVQIVVPMSAEAEKILTDFDSETIEYGKSQPQLACLWAKGEENARRIALIVAAGENFEAPQITAAIADYACRLVRFLLIDFSETIVPEIASSVIENNKRKIINAIKPFGKAGALKKDVTGASRWIDKRGRDNLLGDLQDSGEIVIVAEGKTLRYWTAENYLKFINKE